MDNPGFRCLTWNLLIQNQGPTDLSANPKYTKIEDKSILTQKYRQNLICKRIDESNPDICCFQEVDLNQFEKDFENFFTTYAYQRHHIDKKQKRPFGNVTMWKSDLFELDKSEFKPSIDGLLTKLICKKTNFFVTICNVHLKANQKGKEILCEKARISQITSYITKSKIDFTSDKSEPMCICGDFNDFLLDSSPLRNVIKQSKFIIADPQKTSYSYTADEYLSFDQICSHKLIIEVDPVPELVPIPSATMPSDHFPIFFTINRSELL